MFSLYSYIPAVAPSIPEVLQIPGISPVSKSSVPHLLLAPNSLFASIIFADSPKLSKLNGIIINSFEGLEPQSINALKDGKVREGLPPLFFAGPFLPCEFERVKSVDKVNSPFKWLDDQPEGSVVYICFGSRTDAKRELIGEIGEGLIRSGFRFLWVVKDKKVDKEDEDELDELVGDELMRKLKDRGIVVKTWVDQKEILSHPAVGRFVCHCGWNSVTEAAMYGVRILAWPQHGDQKMNAELVEMSGLGMWKKKWGWGEKELVKAEEIGKAIQEMMTDESLKTHAAKIREAARTGAGIGGSCQATFGKLIDEWKKKRF